jgi:hypothetical protein
MFRALLLAACAAPVFVNSAAKAEHQGYGSFHAISGLELGTRLSTKTDSKIPPGNQAKSSPAETSEAAGTEPPSGHRHGRYASCTQRRSLPIEPGC